MTMLTTTERRNRCDSYAHVSIVLSLAVVGRMTSRLRNSCSWWKCTAMRSYYVCICDAELTRVRCKH